MLLHGDSAHSYICYDVVYRHPYLSPERLNACSREQRLRIREAQMEAARVYEMCIEMHAEARSACARWPSSTKLQQAAKGRFALHSQSVQAVCKEFYANVLTTSELRRTGDKRANYPKKSAKYRPLAWPSQSVCVSGNRIVLPMGRGCKSLVFDKPADFPEAFGTVKLVFDGGRYALHVPVELEQPSEPVLSAETQPTATTTPQKTGLAACDLGEIHQGALVTTTGEAVVVSGRGIRSVKRRRHKQLGEIARKRSRCTKGSRRHRRLNFAREKASARAGRQVRDLRHKGTTLLTEAADALDIGHLFVGDPHGVRKRDSGRKHNQRMSGWEHGKDKSYLAQKGERLGISVSFGDERGTSSTCPGCGKRHRPRSRVFQCPHCGLRAHRDVVGGVNQARRAWGLAEIPVPDASRITYLRPGAVPRGTATALRMKSKGPSVSSSRPGTGRGEATTSVTRVAAALVSADSTSAAKATEVQRETAPIGGHPTGSEAHPL